MWSSNPLKTILALVLVVAMAGCQAGAPVLRTQAATDGGVFALSDGSYGPQTPTSGLRDVCMQGGWGGGGGGLIGIAILTAPVWLPVVLVGGLLFVPLEGLVDALRRR